MKRLNKMFESNMDNYKHRTMKTFDRHAACASARGRVRSTLPSQLDRERDGLPPGGAPAPFQQRSIGVRPRERTIALSGDLSCPWQQKQPAFPTLFQVAQGQSQDQKVDSQPSRPSKRGKPLARRNLQALFDAAADEDSNWQMNIGTPMSTSLSPGATGPSDQCSQDTEDTDESDQSISVESLASPSPQKAYTAGPSTPAVSDTFPLASSPCPDSAAEISFIPLKQLLESSRGKRLSADEVKAMFYCIVRDLDRIHRRNIVHCSVSLDAISLECSDEDTPLAVATLLPGRFMRTLGASRTLFGPREKNCAAYSPPETANCPVSRAVYTPHGDMWAAGIVLFAMLAGHGGSLVPFGSEGILSIMSRMKHRGLHSVDSLQSWLKRHLELQMDAINAENMQEANVVFDDLARSLVLGLLRADPAQRLPAEKVLKHAWFTDVISKVPERSLQKEIQPLTGPSSPCARLEIVSDDCGLNEVVRRTETLQVNQEFPWVDHVNTNAPYPVIGYVAQPIEIPIDGRSVMMSALHTVYEVPNRGTMMAATPTAVVHPAEVTAMASRLARRHSI